MKIIGKRAFQQEGQILITAVLFMAVLLGLTAMAIDMGLFYEERRQFQNSADAMALAGVAELPLNPLLARAKAEEWADNNDVDASEIKKIEVRTTGFTNDTLYVELEGEFSWIFARVLGHETDNVGAKAAARVGTLAGGNKMMPWALLEGDTNCLDAAGHAIFGASCVVKVGASNSIASGWRGALDFDGTGGGANEYRDNIIDGTAEWSYCIAGQDPPPCHSVVDALQGNKVGPTGQGIDERLAQGAECDVNGNGKDDFDEVFEPTGEVSPAYTVACPDSPWLIIIPIVSFDSTPVHEVTIRGWTLAYLKNYGCFSDSASSIAESRFVLSESSTAIGASREAGTGTSASKPCNHNHKPQAPSSSENEPFVMAVEPGEPLPASLHGPNKPPACHQGVPHGQQQCTPSPTPTPPPAPTPTATPAATPSTTPNPGSTPTPAATASPTPAPAPGADCKNGKGHWEVSIEIADAAYSQTAGFLGNYDPTAGVLVRRLIQ